MASRKCGKWDDGPVVDDELCEYELKRRENIKINQEMMKALGKLRLQLKGNGLQIEGRVAEI